MGAQLSLFEANEVLQQETRLDQILQRFMDFHRANPAIWRAFVRFTFELVEAGRENGAAKAVIERIRWETAIRSTGEPVKVNNDFAPHYARLFHLCYPKHDGFFRLRALQSAERRAYEEDMPVAHLEEADARVERAVRTVLARLLPKEEA